ncbi:MAG: nitroreductase family protein [Armatimonadota bacterium]
MELMEAIYTRRTVRNYTSDPVPRETLQWLLDAAVQAPTGMNTQPWAFGVLEGVDRLKDFSDRAKGYLRDHLSDFPDLERYRGLIENPEINLCHGAPACIVIYAKPGATPVNDCSMAAQNVMLAACALGLGTCWVGFLSFLLNQPEVKAELGVPDGYQVIAPIVVGRPLSSPPPVPRNAPEVVYWQA